MSSLKELLKNEPAVSSLPVVDAHADEFKKGVYMVTKGVFIAIGYALANSICVETDTGLIIIDTLEDVDSARIVCKEFKRLTSNKPIKSIIFTHSHFDHVTGIKGFVENEKVQPTIYLHEECVGHQQRNSMFKYGIGARTTRQFGTILSQQLPFQKEKNWFKNSGIGPRLNATDYVDDAGNITKTHEHSMADSALLKTFGKEFSFEQDGVKVEMFEAFGETDDQILIYIPKHSLLLPGDNIYRSFPNIYAIRGVEPRNAYAWYKSIEKMMHFVEKYNVEYMAPSHSRHIVGKDKILSILTAYRDGISYVHDQTIRYLNQQYSQDEIVRKVEAQKPKELFNHPYLLQFYGTIEWSVRAVFMKSMGWFSGKVDDLFPCPKSVRSELTMEAMKYAAIGDGSAVEESMVKYIEFMSKRNREGKSVGYYDKTSRDDKNRYLLEATTQLLIRLNDEEKMKQYKGKEIAWKELKERTNMVRFETIRDMASYQTSAPARNYLLTYWLEEKYDLEIRGSGGNFKDIVMKRPKSWVLRTLVFHVDPIKCRQNIEKSICGVIELCDVKQVYKYVLKNIGVMQLTETNEYDEKDEGIDWILKTNERTLKYILTMDRPKTKKQKEVKTGHLIPRIRTASGAFIAVIFGMIAGPKAKQNGLIKGRAKAVAFFRCLEYETVSRL